MHEQMIGIEDAAHTYEYDEYYKILPAINNWSLDPARIGSGRKVPRDFSYSSDNNVEWMTSNALKAWLAENTKKISLGANFLS